MSWESRLLGEKDAAGSLPDRIEALFARQRESWPALREGEEALARVETRTLADSGARVVVQANPGRRQSTHARVDPDSVAARPCFLCPENLPAAERGLGTGRFVVLCNPHPVLRLHCTIAHREHRPQRIGPHLDDLLHLAQALGPGMLAFYNGPRCGASAPDHLHFQACRATGVPLLDELADIPTHGAYTSFGRNLLVFTDPDPARLAGQVRTALDALARIVAAPDEPMCNLVVTSRGGHLLVVLFPRARHRPEAFFARGDAHLAVSPAALEMAGVLVVADPDHLERIDTRTTRAIYQEVSLDPARFAALAREVT